MSNMNRRSFFRHVGAGGLVAATWPAWGAEGAKPQTPPSPVAFTTAPSLQYPSATGVTLAIGVNRPSTAWIEYGETEQLGRVATGSQHGLHPFDAIAHRVRLEELRPGQRYFYRVCASPIDFVTAYDIRRGDPVATGVFQFRTLDPEAAQARFVVWNDTHENAATLARLTELTPPLAPDFLVWNGDIPNDNYREDRMVESYVGANGQPFTREVPLVYVRGNHDTRGPAARSLPRLLEPPGGRFYYSFRQGPLAGVVLDAGEDKPDTEKVYAGLGDFVAYRREQTAWLEAELKKPHLRQARFRVAFCHIPFWWKDQNVFGDPTDPRSAWHRLLARAKFSAVISGHTHQHGLFPPDRDRPYAQMVGGSHKPEAATLIHGVVTAKELTLRMTALDGRELAAWNVKR